MEGDYEYEEEFSEILAAIYEAQCADCINGEPHHLCCNAFMCKEHYLNHCQLFHPGRIEHDRND